MSVKKLTLLALACGFALAVHATALAAPSAEVSMAVSDVGTAGGDLTFTVSVAVSAPSEPYASLDFNLVTSDHDDLSVIDLSETSDATDLDISFAPGYGKAYHGQDDPATGGYRYLIGIFSNSLGNQITESVPVCSIRLRYSGEEPQTLRIRDMKLVYVDSGGNVVSAPVDSDGAVLPVDSSLFEGFEASVPLSEAPASRRSEIPIVIWIAIGAVAGLGAAFLARRRASAHKRQ